MEYISALEDRLKYLENPINSFKLIKRLTTDLDFTERNIEQASGIFISIKVTFYVIYLNKTFVSALF